MKWASLMAQQVRNLPTMARDTGSIPGLGKSPGGGKWQSTPVFLPKKSCAQRSLAGCSPEGRKESDTADRLSMHRGELELDKQGSSVQFSSVQSLSRVRLFATPWTAHARLPYLSPAPGAYSNSCPLCQ